MERSTPAHDGAAVARPAQHGVDRGRPAARPARRAGRPGRVARGGGPRRRAAPTRARCARPARRSAPPSTPATPTALNAVLAHGRSPSGSARPDPSACSRSTTSAGACPGSPRRTCSSCCAPGRTGSAAAPAAGCVLRFYDASRGGRRQWCSMAACGNRAKARRHYARARGRDGARERAAGHRTRLAAPGLRPVLQHGIVGPLASWHAPRPVPACSSRCSSRPPRPAQRPSASGLCAQRGVDRRVVGERARVRGRPRRRPHAVRLPAGRRAPARARELVQLRLQRRRRSGPGRRAARRACSSRSPTTRRAGRSRARRGRPTRCATCARAAPSRPRDRCRRSSPAGGLFAYEDGRVVRVRGGREEVLDAGPGRRARLARRRRPAPLLDARRAAVQ